MCASMMIRKRGKELKTVFGLSLPDVNEDDSYETRVYPHLPYPVILEENGKTVLKVMNYSLIPRWSKTLRPKFASYNARIETISEKPTWKEPLSMKRCLVPVEAFYESCYEGTHAGNIVEFRGKENALLPVAGVWEEWIDKTSGEVTNSFAVITTEPTEFILKTGHDRCPLFLSTDAISSWLKPVKRNADDCRQFLIDNFHEPKLCVEVDRPLKAGWEKRK